MCFVIERKDNLVFWYHTVDTLRTGILITDESNIVTGFLEKPHPEYVIS
jgi:hypothetical protein